MPRQVDHATRRIDISTAVLQIAADRGFHEVTIRAVAAHVGASTSRITHYVSGRDELIRIAVRREVEIQQAKLTQLLASSTTPIRTVVDWAVFGASAKEHEGWLAIVVGAQTEPVVRAELDSFNRWWDTLMRRLIGKPANADVIDVLIDGLILSGFEAPDQWTRERRQRVVDAVLTPLGY